MVDHLGQVPAQPRQQFLARQSALRGNRVDLIGAQRLGEIIGCNLLVRAGTDPGIGDLAMAVLLELLDQVTEAAAQDASGRAAGEQAPQSALEEIAKTA